MDSDRTERLHDDKATSKTQGNPRTDSAQTAAFGANNSTNSYNNALKLEYIGIPINNKLEPAQFTKSKANDTYCCELA